MPEIILAKYGDETIESFLVEEEGFEPAASWSQTMHSTKLSYTSIKLGGKLKAI